MRPAQATPPISGKYYWNPLPSSHIYYFTDYTLQSSACQATRTFVHKLFTVTGTSFLPHILTSRCKKVLDVCIRFVTHVTMRHAKLASDAAAHSLPGGRSLPTMWSALSGRTERHAGLVFYNLSSAFLKTRHKPDSDYKLILLSNTYSLVLYSLSIILATS